MIDFGYPLRQKFIAESATLDAKRAELRARMHEQGRYFLGEELLAEKHGGSIFNPRKGSDQNYMDDRTIHAQYHARFLLLAHIGLCI